MPISCSGCLLCALLVMFAVGCDSESASQQQATQRDRALKDPMRYNPAEGTPTDISGGGFLNFDKKAFDKDMNSALNP